MAELRSATVSDKYRDAREEDVALVCATLEGSLSGTSEAVGLYEEALAEWFEARHAVALSSGTAAISVALFAAGVSAGDEVLLAPTSPLCTVYPVLAAGAVPVFCDTRSDNFGLDPASIAERASPRARAILEVPMWGYPTPAVELRELARAMGVPLIFDLAHAHGTTLGGAHLSRHADVSCFSTHDRKPLSTGEGGFVLTDDGELAERARSFSRFGHLGGVEFGLNYKLGALQASLGRSRLRRLGDQIKARRSNAREIVAQLANPRVAELPIVPGGDPNYYALLLRLGYGDNRAFLAFLDRSGVPSDILRYGGKCLYDFPAVSAFRRPCPQAEALLGSITTIPVHPAVDRRQLDHIVALLNHPDWT
jgi:dTDP-4-amino-4,6-dideoxygalactose transaminase